MEPLGVCLERPADGVIGVLRPEIDGVRSPIHPAGLGVVHVGIDQPRAEIGAGEVDNPGAAGTRTGGSSAGAGDASLIHRDTGIRNRFRTGTYESGVLEREVSSIPERGVLGSHPSGTPG